MLWAIFFITMCNIDTPACVNSIELNTQLTLLTLSTHQHNNIMKHHLFTILTALLALTACNDDEPNDVFNDSDDSGIVYVTITDNEQDYIYSLDGEMIYQTEPGYKILNLAADGKDWYAVVMSPTYKHNCSLIKNGTTIYAPAINRFSEVAVSNGDFYTLEMEPQYTDDLHWPSEYGRIYSIHKNGALQYEFGVKIDDPFSNLRLRPTPTQALSVVVEYHSGSDHQLWVDGQQYPLPEIPVDPDHLSTIDIENNDLLVLYWVQAEDSHKYMYWHNNQTDWIDKNLTMRYLGLRDISLHQGKVYILGSISHEKKQEGITRYTSQPVLYIDGKKKTFDVSGDNEEARRMRFHGNSLYVLMDDSDELKTFSRIYKGRKPLPTDSIYLQSKGKKVSLGDLRFNDFIVADK